MGEVTLQANTYDEQSTGQSGSQTPLQIKSPKRISLISGGFDPLHSGHIALLQAAKDLTGFLVVAINSDEWLERKKGRSFMPVDERRLVITNLRQVNNVVEFDDSDDTAIDAIRRCRALYPESKILFCNGGDRKKGNTPEQMGMISWDNVEFVFGVGGNEKMNSSSWILEHYKYPKTDRIWGYYRVLFEYGSGVKVKELTVDPHKSLSMQRHKHRKELWFVSEGTAKIYTISPVSSDVELIDEKSQHQQCHIQKNQWHMLANETDIPLRVIEIQYGTEAVESDIERKMT